MMYRLSLVMGVLISSSWFSCKKELIQSRLSVLSAYPEVVPTGEPLTIYGEGFDPSPENNDVTVNGVSAEVAVASRNKLVVTLPSNASSGTLQVAVKNQHAQFKNPIKVVVVIDGSGGKSLGLLALNSKTKYLLRKNVVVDKLIVPAGTVIYAEKESNASLACARVDIEGTQNSPIIFTSNQPAGKRNPGDWAGIIIRGGVSIPSGIMRYCRVEYAGSGSRGNRAALTFQVSSYQNSFEYLQVSYSAGDAYSFAVNAAVQSDDQTTVGQEKVAIFRNLVAFACAGADFSLNASQSLFLQYVIGIKDPMMVLPSSSKSAGIVMNTENLVAPVNVRISNATLIGSNPSARNIPELSTELFYLNRNSDALVNIGSSGNLNTNSQTAPNFYLFNSLLIGSTKASILFRGASLPGVTGENSSWNSLGTDVKLERNVITGYKSFNGLKSLDEYNFGGPLARSNYLAPLSSVLEDIRLDPKYLMFFDAPASNDTTHRLDFRTGDDDLGVAGVADYQRFKNPNFLPRFGSFLLDRSPSELFPSGTEADVPQFNKAIGFVGAFGKEDWTAGWSNFNPQDEVY